MLKMSAAHIQFKPMRNYPIFPSKEFTNFFYNISRNNDEQIITILF